MRIIIEHEFSQFLTVSHNFSPAKHFFSQILTNSHYFSFILANSHSPRTGALWSADSPKLVPHQHGPKATRRSDKPFITVVTATIKSAPNLLLFPKMAQKRWQNPSFWLLASVLGGVLVLLLAGREAPEGKLINVHRCAQARPRLQILNCRPIRLRRSPLTARPLVPVKMRRHRMFRRRRRNCRRQRHCRVAA